MNTRRFRFGEFAQRGGSEIFSFNMDLNDSVEPWLLPFTIVYHDGPII